MVSACIYSRRVWRWPLLLLLCFTLFSPSLNASEAPTDPVIMRAVWLERFTRYIDWPGGSRVADANTPFTLCVWGDDNFAKTVHDLYQQQTIKDKTVLVSQRTDIAQLQDCDLLYLSSVKTADLRALLDKVRGQPTLLVSAQAGNAELGVHINMYEEQGYQRFEINIDDVKSSGLVIRSRLLQVARIIHHAGPS